MKRIIICIILFLFAINISAQHMSFMGIPMGSHFNTFRKSLESKGFKLSTDQMDNPNFYNYEGYFAGYKVGLVVSTTPTSKKVSDVWVIFSEFFHFKSGYNLKYGAGVSMDDVENLYLDLTDKLVSKYGLPKGYDENSKFLKNLFFQTDAGNIMLTEEFLEDINCVRLTLYYSDKLTKELGNQEKINDL